MIALVELRIMSFRISSGMIRWIHLRLIKLKEIARKISSMFEANGEIDGH